MQIRQITARHLRLPAAASRFVPLTETSRAADRPIEVVWAEIVTDSGQRGVGFVIADDATELVSIIGRSLAPRLIGEPALAQERLYAHIAATGMPTLLRAYTALDIAVWDLQGQAASEPLWRIWGGARDKVRVFFDEAVSPSIENRDSITRCQEAIRQGFQAVRVSIAGRDAESESRQLVDLRDATGDNVWFAVAVEQSYEYDTALPMARFLDEEIGADWFEDALPDDDVLGYKLLTLKTETALAMGRRFQTAGQFRALVAAGIPFTLRPDPLRWGGLTPLLKWVAFAAIHHRPVVPHTATEISVHLACGLPNVPTVGWDPRLAVLFLNPLSLQQGQLSAPNKPGLGLEPDYEALERLTVAKVG
jgi:L-alanine-DL-glutamate epimerase-like enolase superfamily enzyme